MVAREVGEGEERLEKEEEEEAGGKGGEGEGVEVRIPRYDKSARGGRGDRAPEEEWEVVSARPEIVLLEGWMLGFEALPDDSPVLLAAPEEGGGEEKDGEGVGELVYVVEG